MKRSLATALTSVLVTLAVMWAGALAPHAALPTDIEPSVTTAHFHFYAHGDVQASVDKIAGPAEERWARLCAELGACGVLKPGERIDVWVADDPERFASAFPDGAPMAEWAAGVAFIGARRVVLRAHGSALFTLRETFDHELSHILLHEVAADGRLPRWFSEGVAIWQSGEGVLGRLETAHLAALTGNLLPMEAIDRRFPNQGATVSLAYAQSALFTRHLMQRYGAVRVLSLARAIGAGQTFEAAFATSLGAPVSDVFEAWSDGLEGRSTIWVLFSNEGFFWVLMAFLFIFAAIVQLRNRRLALADMEQEELAEEALEEIEQARLEGHSPTLH
ncbi:MAG: hypothetical protein ACI9MR_001861 [Myxococcota bacterium]|jgi:hypothetical protein